MVENGVYEKGGRGEGDVLTFNMDKMNMRVGLN
jgi:hypothetical protein